MRAIVFALVIFAPLSANAIEEGYVYGKDHCFYFTAPQGWIADPVSGRSQGLPFVFYPSGSTWTAAKIVAYARVADKIDGVSDAKAQVARTIKQFRTEYESPNIRARKVATIRARSGSAGDLYQFEGDKFGNTELVVYFSGRKTINFFVMSSRNPEDLNKNRAVIEELAKSYREADDCKPCRIEQVGSSCGAAHTSSGTTLSQPTLAELKARNRELTSTSEGKRYEMDAIRVFFGDARFMRECAPPNAPIAQSLDMFFEVNPDGRMNYLVITPETEVAECIRKHIADRRFPPPSQPFVVNINLKFKE